MHQAVKILLVGRKHHVAFEGIDSYIQPILVAVLETVRDRFFGGVDLNGCIIDTYLLDAGIIHFSEGHIICRGG